MVLLGWWFQDSQISYKLADGFQGLCSEKDEESKQKLNLFFFFLPSVRSYTASLPCILFVKVIRVLFQGEEGGKDLEDHMRPECGTIFGKYYIACLEIAT